MNQAVNKFCFYYFVFQNILGLRIKNGKAISCHMMALVNLLVPDLTYVSGIYAFIAGDFHKALLTMPDDAAISPFLNQVIEVIIYFSRPMSIGTVSLLLHTKRHKVEKFLTICSKITTKSKFEFDDTIKNGLVLLFLLQTMIVTQWILIYNLYYVASWLSFVVMVVSTWSRHLCYYVVLLAIFFVKFIIKLLNETLKISSMDTDTEHTLFMINDLLVRFNEAFGLPLSFALISIIFTGTTEVTH